MKKIIRVIALFILSFIFLSPTSVKALDETSYLSWTLTPSKNYQYSDYDYVIDKYDINIKVNENNSFDITETITAYFNKPKHGIYRTIPLNNTIKRLDGTTSYNRAHVRNLSVNDDYTKSTENRNLKLKIGSANTAHTGEKTYVIKYNYNLGKDPIKDYDELYYNIIGNEWDTVIGNVTFTVTMPKEFDQSKLGFSSGIKNLTDNSKIDYSVDENKISGSYNGILGVGEGITIRCELPEGYFIIPKINPLNYILYLIPIIFLLISLLLWYKFGRDDKVIETVEFYPPEGFNSLEVGFLYNGEADSQDVISLLIYLANKGYIKITETKDKKLLTQNKGFKITKLKDYDGTNENERLFLEGLFKRKNSANEVTSKSLYNNFYTTTNTILSNINDKENKNKIFEKMSASKKIFIILMIIIAFCLITIPPVYLYGDPETLLFGLLFPGIGFTFTTYMLMSGSKTVYVNGKATTSSLAPKIFGLLWGLGFGGVPWALLVLPALIEDQFYFIYYVIGIICIIGMVICIKYLPKRTPYGNEMLGKIKGFKNYLETAEKEKLEAMVLQNPTYFYDILPYTYVLGVSDKWIKKFESITLRAPEWYDSDSPFDMPAFNRFMDSTMDSARSVMTSSPSSSSSSSSSGGGMSGGGSGGGGGGSW